MTTIEAARVRELSIVSEDGVRLAVTERGPRDASHTVVLLHGFCLSKTSWEPHAEELARLWGDDIRVITYDHRGHGLSAAADMGTYTVPQLARDLSSVLRWSNPRGSVTLAGHSMGGMTILEYLGMSDRSVEPTNVLLVATAAGKLPLRGMGRALALPAVAFLHANVGRVPDRVLDPILRALTEPVVSRIVRHVAYTEDGGKASATAAAWSINATPMRTKIGFLDALKRFDAYETLPRISADTLILSGGKDFLTPKAHSDDMQWLIPNAEHIHYPRNGHMILHEEFSATINALNLFVSDYSHAHAV